MCVVNFLSRNHFINKIDLSCNSIILSLSLLQLCYSADIVIEIPGNLGQDDSSYRLDYFPPYGNPMPNTTIASKDVGDEIRFSNVLAGTKYNFWLYYTNSTHHNLLAWTVSITTGKLNLFSFSS